MILVLCAAFMTSCSGGDTNNTASNAETTVAAENNGNEGSGETAKVNTKDYKPGSKYVFDAGKTISINMPSDAFLKDLGDPVSYFESESCAFQGLDKTYTYKDFVITTYPKDDVDYVFSIELLNDVVTTPEGAYIGMSADDVKALYPEGPTEESDKALQYVDGDSKLSFILDNGEVSSICYTSSK